MAKEAVFVRDGDIISYTNASSSVTISCGDVVVFAGSIGVAETDILPLAVGAVRVTGVFTLPGNNNLEIAVGDLVYWDVDDGNVNKTSASNIPAGFAVTAKTTTGTTVNVRIG